jgi:DNA-binding beta-propeller fold protein YncE
MKRKLHVLHFLSIILTLGFITGCATQEGGKMPFVSTIAGGEEGFADGKGSAAQFYHPAGIAIDAVGNLYVADFGNSRIRKVTPKGEVSTIAGSKIGFADGSGNAAQFFSPSGIAIDAAGNLYVADTYNHRIRKVTPKGEVSTIAGSEEGFADGQGSAAQFNIPFGIAIDAAGNLYVAAAFNHRIRKIAFRRP